jgi:(p)ppGpp synthase/HD superfamily hydrolase
MPSRENKEIRFTVEQAVSIAHQAHAGQLDKAGAPYIEHPLRVMGQVTSEYEQMTAVLHDVIEDTSISAADLLSQGCPQKVVAAVIALTKSPGESLADYLRRVATDPLALAVKRADIADNSIPERLNLLDRATKQRLQAKYAQSTMLLDKYESLIDK